MFLHYFVFYIIPDNSLPLAQFGVRSWLLRPDATVGSLRRVSGREFDLRSTRRHVSWKKLN